VTAKTVTASMLLLLTMSAHAQGVISSIARPTGPPALPPPLPVPSVNTALNPFLPHPAALPVLPPTVTNTPRTPIDPVRAALAAQERETREHGVRLGVVDGQVIYRHEGHYLIEPVTARQTGAPISGPPGRKRDPGQCVIHIVHLPTEKASDNTEQAHPARANAQTASNL
jgi:hypothetical protein